MQEDRDISCWDLSWRIQATLIILLSLQFSNIQWLKVTLSFQDKARDREKLFVQGKYLMYLYLNGDATSQKK